MKGKQHVYVDTPRVKYDIQIENKVTIIRGDSGTGKTTLVGLVMKKHKVSDGGIKIVSSLPVKALWSNYELEAAEFIISNTQNSIIFMDETVEGIESKEIAKAINASSNYFVIVTRDNLSNIPFAVDALYEFRYDNKTMVNSLVRIYATSKNSRNVTVPTHLLVEDEKAGYTFYKAVCKNEADCTTAKGKDNILECASKIISNMQSGKLLVIADGAAFGNNIESLMKLEGKSSKIALFLPDSFEYVLLHSVFFKDNDEVQDALGNPADNIDTSFASREIFFEQLLCRVTAGSNIKYTKKSDLACYICKCCSNKLINSRETANTSCKYKIFDRNFDKIGYILDQIKGIDFSGLR